MNRDQIEKIPLSGKPRVSVVIPHFYASRDDKVNRLIQSLKDQSFRDMEILVIHGVSPQGRAINQGARASKGDVLVVMDDDSQIGHPRLIENLVSALDQEAGIGMAGASILTPSSANFFQRMAAKQFPRFNMPVVNKITDSDLACHGCVAFRRDVFEQVGMERGDIPRGLDPDLRVRIRKAGYRVVLVPDSVVYHPLPESFSKFIKVFFRNGCGSAYLQMRYPQISYDTDEVLESARFVPKRSFLYRILRFPVRLLRSLILFQWLRLLGYLVYSVGYGVGLGRFAWSRVRGGAREGKDLACSRKQ